jgi:GNAT superfamily N-acetyltransferase
MVYTKVGCILHLGLAFLLSLLIMRGNSDNSSRLYRLWRGTRKNLGPCQSRKKQNMSIHLRTIRSEDEKFLLVVYSSTRSDEMRLVDWNEEQKEAFLRMQFNAQHQYYIENYPGAEFQIVLLDDQPIGRLYIHRRENEIRIMDITILPEFRKRGIGSSVIIGILEDAAYHHLPVTIHVERFNPALYLYERLGFHLAEDKGVYYFMKCLPPIKEQQHEYIGQTEKR